MKLEPPETRFQRFAEAKREGHKRFRCFAEAKREGHKRFRRFAEAKREGHKRFRCFAEAKREGHRRFRCFAEAKFVQVCVVYMRFLPELSKGGILSRDDLCEIRVGRPTFSIARGKRFQQSF